MSPTRDHESDASLRIAWVTIALLIAIAAGFVYAKVTTSGATAAVDEQLEEAEQYFRKRPYLDLPTLLELRLSRETADQLAARYEDNLRRRGGMPIPPRLRAREQAELEALMQDAAAVLVSQPEQRMALRASQTEPSTYATHLFIHTSGVHLLVGLGLLFLIGYFLEGTWGPFVHAGVVAFTALGAGGLFVLQSSDTGAAYVGTVGLTAGLAVAFVVRLLGSGRGAPVVFVSLASLVAVAAPIWLGLGWSLLPDPVDGAGELAGMDPTLWAVIGGAGTGALAGGLVRLVTLDVDASRQDHDREGSLGGINENFERALQEHAAGNLEEAYNLLVGVLRREPDDLDACIALWSIANDLGRPGAAGKAILRVIRDEVQREDIGGAIGHWLELTACGLLADAEPALSIRMAALLRRDGHDEPAIAALKNALLQADGANAVSVAMRVAREAADLDPATARDAIWLALGSHDLDNRDRQDMESLLSVVQASLDPDEEPDVPVPADPEASVSAADILSPSEAEAELGMADTQPAPIEIDDNSRGLELVVAIPTEIDDEGLLIEVEGGRKKRVRFDRVEAVAVAAVDGLGERTVIVVDLVLNWMSLTAEPLRVIRLRGDRFDPRRLIGDEREALQALRALIREVVEKSDATPLPDLQSVSGMPFAAFPNLVAYHRDVLMVDSDSPAL